MKKKYLMLILFLIIVSFVNFFSIRYLLKEK